MYWYVQYHIIHDTITVHLLSDIGECLIGTHNCSEVCVELEGGYECDCFSDAYELADDGVTCEGSYMALLCGVFVCNHDDVFIYQ